MNALFAYRDAQANGPVVTGLDREAAEAARRTGFVVLATSAYGECICPHDCPRDHENE